MRTEVTKLPEVFLDRLQYIFPQKRYHELVNTFAFKKPVSFRVNTAKITIPEVKERLVKHKIKMFPITWCPGAYYVDETIYKLQKLPLYENGEIYIQRLSSMIPPLILKPKKEHLVLDMAAAPGSKTLQMSNLMENQGLIIACDKDEIRVEKLFYNIEKQEAKNVRVRMVDATKVWKEYPDYFDKVLLDAPCSSEGRFYVYDSKTYSHWSEKFIKKISHLQKKLLASGLVSLKVGGELVYSTCTFAPEENEEVIDWVIQMVGDRIEIEEFKVKVSNIGPSVAKWQGKNYAKKVSRAIRILPNRELEGFFICKIRKLKKITV